MPYDGAGATTNVVISPTRSVWQDTYDIPLIGFTYTSNYIPTPAAARAALTIRCELAPVDVPNVNLQCSVYGLTTPAVAAWRKIDGFVLYGTDAVDDGNSTQVYLTQEYQIAYPVMVVRVTNYPFTTFFTVAGGLFIDFVMLGF